MSEKTFTPAQGCRYCGKPILMAEEPEGWRPRNPDGTPHRCRDKSHKEQNKGLAENEKLPTEPEDNGPFIKIDGNLVSLTKTVRNMIEISKRVDKLEAK